MTYKEQALFLRSQLKCFTNSAENDEVCFKPLVSDLRWGFDIRSLRSEVDCVWNVMAHGDAREENWRGNKRMEWVTSKRHITAEHRLARAVQTLQADEHDSSASSRLNWRPRRFKCTRPFRRKTKSGFCVCAITFQTQSDTFNFFWPSYLWIASGLIPAFTRFTKEVGLSWQCFAKSLRIRTLAVELVRVKLIHACQICGVYQQC